MVYSRELGLISTDCSLDTIFERVLKKYGAVKINCPPLSEKISAELSFLEGIDASLYLESDIWRYDIGLHGDYIKYHYALTVWGLNAKKIDTFMRDIEEAIRKEGSSVERT